MAALQVLRMRTGVSPIQFNYHLKILHVWYYQTRCRYIILIQYRFRSFQETKKIVGLIILTKNANPKLTATITGTVSDSSQLLAGMNVVDISSANQTVYTTNAYGSFTVTLQLTSTYVAHLVISDPNSIYTNYMRTVTINPGVAMTLPLIVLKKSKTATTITTITGTVSDSTHQLLSGLKVVDINSVNRTIK